MKLPLKFFRSCVLCSLLLWLSTSGLAQDWKPLDPAHVALKAPTIDKDADAEALFWEVRVQDEPDGYGGIQRVLSHYVRLKIFTERGVEQHGKVDIIFFNKNSISNIAARTFKPDGTMVELKKDAIFEREVVKLSGFKVKAKNFALPAVTPGCIVEYRWKEARPATVYMRLQLQREYPIQQVKYYIRPASDVSLESGASAGMNSITFHGQTTPFVKEPNGFSSTTATNVPAFKEEARMPPEDQVRAWMLLFYTSRSKIAPAEYWKSVGKRLFENTKGLMKVNDEVKKAAATIIGDATDPDQKLQRLLEFCRTKIRNIHDDTEKISDEERKKLKENKSPSDTLKNGYGTGTDIDMLFAALTIAAGFDARRISLSDRSDIFFDANMADDYFLNYGDIAVKIGENWRLIDPSSKYVPYGMLRWQQEGIPGLLADQKEPSFIKTPISPPEKSLSKRTAKLRLNEEGTLEGDVQIEYTGHAAVSRKEDLDEKSPSEREEWLRDTLKSRMGGVELTDIKIENVTDPFKPLIFSYKVKMPGYAERTGKRLFLQPAFFQKGIAPLFSTSVRQHDIYFSYPWLEEDSVNIALPAGYSLDNAEAPASFPIGPVGDYKVNLAVTKDAKILVYERKFKFEGMIFPKNIYVELKRAFDMVHQQDNHAITLKQGAATAGK
jgi:hypothetical protein